MIESYATGSIIDKKISGRDEMHFESDFNIYYKALDGKDNTAHMERELEWRMVRKIPWQVILSKDLKMQEWPIPAYVGKAF